MPEPEYRGSWPGGWRELEDGQLALAIRGAGAGRWACDYCRTGRLHSELEHQQLLRLSSKEGS